ncbi:MAG: 23S rRNA (adenine(2503)-C(2))-methyltransferase RlmN [Clostridiales bacterium]|nr:23S rRNA (adenine(2503)-C(2))-methyltransferase RlmN [Clostridiales bacterium]
MEKKNKKLLLDLNFKQLQGLCLSLGQQKFRAEQIYSWLLLGADYEAMSNLPKSFLQQLEQSYLTQSVFLKTHQIAKDGTTKYLFELKCGGTVESVFLPNKYGNTVCISSQVGCKFDCKFCASALNGFSRNCSNGEILGQVIAVNRHKGGNVDKRAFCNIVLMGSGEPLDNYDNVLNFLHSILDSKGLNFSNRNISLSTCGLVDKIKKLADQNLGITLSISLHATTDESRQVIMPVAKAYSIKDILEAAKYYFDKTGRRVAFEYIMIKDLNTSHHDAVRLSQMTKQLSCHVNLINLNSVNERNLKGVDSEHAKRFCQKLLDLGVSATIRRTQGQDIDGACGQLRNKFV